MLALKHLQRHLWAPGDFVALSGSVTDEAMMEYISPQDGTELDNSGDNFQVTKL